MKTNNQTFVRAFNRMNGSILEDINMLESMKFDQSNMDELADLCEAYHQDKLDQESFNDVGEYHFSELENSIYKYTSVGYWNLQLILLVWNVLYRIGLFVYSLFVNSKDFKK